MLRDKNRGHQEPRSTLPDHDGLSLQSKFGSSHGLVPNVPALLRTFEQCLRFHCETDYYLACLARNHIPRIEQEEDGKPVARMVVYEAVIGK